LIKVSKLMKVFIILNKLKPHGYLHCPLNQKLCAMEILTDQLGIV